MIDEFNGRNVESEPASAAGSEAAATGEAFPCPACGQMLGPGCRVCVACKRPIDPAEIGRPGAVLAPAPFELAPIPLERVRFPWGLFAVLLLARLAAAAFLNHYLGLRKTFLLLGIFEVLCASWVCFDAIQHGIPKPFRWGLGAALLWIVVFPWYLTRRRLPLASCPFIEAEVGPVTRAVFFLLVVFFLLSVVMIIFKGPLPG